MADEDRIALTCAHASGCTLPCAYLLPGGRISITSRHHGEKHVNIIGLAHLVRLAIDFGLIDERALSRLAALCNMQL